MRTAALFVITLLLIVATHSYTPAQDGAVVNQTLGPPLVAYQQNFYYSGTNLLYICTAQSNVAETSITVSGATNANPVNFTATGHSIEYQSVVGALPAVLISGATSGWTGVNGAWVATPTGANNFTIPVDSTAFGSFAGQSLTVTTRAPRTNRNVWSIRRMNVDGSNNMIFSGWGVLVGGAGSTILPSGSTSMDKRCDQRAASSMAYQ